MPEWYGYNPPFFGGHQGVLSRQSGERIIKNDIMQLLLTSLGERVMRPNFGTILKPSLFDPMTDSLINRIRGNIIEQLRNNETRIDAQVDVIRDDDAQTIKVIVQGVLNNNPNDILLVEVELPFEQN